MLFELNRVASTQDQCDQIWRNFATLEKYQNSLAKV